MGGASYSERGVVKTFTNRVISERIIMAASPKPVITCKYPAPGSISTSQRVLQSPLQRTSSL